MGFISAFGLVELNSYIYQSSAPSDGHKYHRFTQNIIALFHIEGTRCEENCESGSVTVYSQQFSVDNSHRWELTVHSIDILTGDPSVYRVQIYVKNIDCYSYTKTKVSVQMPQRVQPKTSKSRSSILTIDR